MFSEPPPFSRSVTSGAGTSASAKWWTGRPGATLPPTVAPVSASTVFSRSQPRRVASRTASAAARVSGPWGVPGGTRQKKVGVPVSWQRGTPRPRATRQFSTMVRSVPRAGSPSSSAARSSAPSTSPGSSHAARRTRSNSTALALSITAL